MMPASPIRKLVPYADEAKKRGIHIYHLNIGQPDIETPDTMMNAIRNINMKVVEYSHSAGILSYRKKLCEYYKRFNIELTPDEIIITTGGSEGILFAMQTCLNPGEEVIIPEPFYANYNGFAVNSGVTVKPINSSIKTGFELPLSQNLRKPSHRKQKPSWYAIPIIPQATCIQRKNWRCSAIS